MKKFRKRQQETIMTFQFFLKYSDQFPKFQPLLNCVKIVDEDLEWRNGTVQLLSAPLPKITTQTLLDIITNDPKFSVFSACKFLNCVMYSC